jgi:CheY-like chemotaxis protein
LADVRVVDADPALRELLEEWLQPLGHRVVEGGGRVGLVVIDVASPRQGGLEVLKRIAAEHPGAPQLVLSSSFFPGIDCCGDVARTLGVAGVLPKPVSREAVLAAVRRLTGGQ